jgi:ubiquinone/menaquinone biosynthesis C-methylase UbiE
MNYDRIYEYRFRGVDAHKKQFTWRNIASYIHQRLHLPEKVLDPAAGNCEFINNVPAAERWAIDMSPLTATAAGRGVKVITGNTLEVDIPSNYFNGVFVSNFLEHLESQEQVALFLGRMYNALTPGGRIAIIGPNFKYCYKEYFDFADHTVILSELGVAEHLYGAGFAIESVHARFLPLSFRGRMPVTDFLVKTYLNLPVFWPFFGKQFLLIAQKK